MSMVLMCMMPGLEKSTYSFTSGSVNSLKQSPWDGFAVLKSAFNRTLAKTIVSQAIYKNSVLKQTPDSHF